jgi:DNA replication protein DnaC
MNIHELLRALTKLRLGGMAKTLETRLLEAQTSAVPPIDLVSTLVSDELQRRADNLIERRTKQAGFRDPNKTLDGFDFSFNKKMDRRLVFELATGRFIEQHEDALMLGPPGTGKSHLAQAIGRAAIQQGHRVVYREAHVLLAQLAEASVEGNRAEQIGLLAAAPLLIIDDLGMRKLPATAAEDLLELVMRRYERVARRHRRRQRHARPAPPPRSRPAVRPSQLPHAARRLVSRRGPGVEEELSCVAQPVGRFSSVYPWPGLG